MVCSIATPNYLNRLLVLGRSIARHMPHVDFRVVVTHDGIDVSRIQQALDTYVRELAPRGRHEALSLHELSWGDFDPVVAMTIYDIFEFSTALKPSVMAHYLAEGWPRVSYIDADTVVYGDFSTALDDSYDVALTPHVLSEFPAELTQHMSSQILQAGFYNAGFVSVTATGANFLRWWSSHLQLDCRVDKAIGLFHDQKILDLARTIARVQELTEPGWNVAYWNLHERRIFEANGQWMAEHRGSTSPLYFCHFSGFDLARPLTISTYAPRSFSGTTMPREFPLEYAAQLTQGQNLAAIPFTLMGTTPREPLPRAVRDALREDVTVHLRAGLTLGQIREAYSHSPTPSFTQGLGPVAMDFLLGWATHPAIEGVPNAITAFHRTPRGESRRHPGDLIRWAGNHFRREMASFPHVTEEVEKALEQQKKSASPLRITGALTYRAGVAQPPLATLATLERAGISPALRRVAAGVDDDMVWSRLLLRRSPLSSPTASVMSFMNFIDWYPSQQRLFPFALLPQESVDAIWAWELSEMPAEAVAIATQASIHALHGISQWSADNFARATNRPVTRVTGFDLPQLFESATSPRSSFDEALPMRYVLVSLDAKSTLGRKNPDGFLDTWERVSDDFPEVTLVIKTADLATVAPFPLLDRIARTKRVHVIDEDITRDEMTRLIAGAEVYVSLTRSEGLGLGPLEAAALGRPVVYTNYSGIVEFLEGLHYPVAYSMVRVGDSGYYNGPYLDNELWAQPDVLDAAKQLRRALAQERDARADALVVRSRLETAQASIVDWAGELITEAEQRAQNSERRSRLRPLFRLIKVVYRRIPASLRHRLHVALQDGAN